MEKKKDMRGKLLSFFLQWLLVESLGFVKTCLIETFDHIFLHKPDSYTHSFYELLGIFAEKKKYIPSKNMNMYFSVLNLCDLSFLKRGQSEDMLRFLNATYNIFTVIAYFAYVISPYQSML